MHGLRKACVIRSVLFVFVLQTCDVVSAYKQLKTETACTGRCFYTYSLTCPIGQKIAPRDLKYYAKATSDVCPVNSITACQDRQQCCHYYPGDCSVAFDMPQAFNVFQNCSAMQQCGWFRADSVSTRSCSYRPTTNYVAATYGCVDDSSFIDICSNNTLRGSSVNLLYNGSQMLSYSSRAANCNCAVSTSNCESPARLRFRGVDIRLQQDHDISKCHPHSRLAITDTDGSRNFYCQENHFYRGYDDIYFSNSPYARVSLHNQPGLYPSQLWLSIEATMPGVDVVVTCGRLRPESQSFCGPPDILTTPNFGQDASTPADIFAKPDKNEEKEPSENKEKKGKNPVSSFIKSDLAIIIGGAIGGLVFIIIVVVLILCIKRRRQRARKPKMLPHPVPLSEPSSPIHSYPSTDPEENKYGNYYETMASDIPNGNAENSSPFTPGKNMGSFFPTEKKFVYPLECSSPLPPIPPVSVPPLTSHSKDANPYHAPWDASMLQAPNRKKRNDLAYATSDEIQVLIQRMEHDRRNLNEGATASPIPSFSYIHIDDYKIKTPAEKKQEEATPAATIPEDKEDLYVYENDSDSEDEDNDHLHNHDEDGEDADVESEDNNETDNVQGATLGSQGTNEGTPRSNDNFCGSEDTGYRSVGSPEHILVCEDDYLVPGSVKSAVSSNSKDTASTVRVGDRGSISSSHTYGEVYDALKDGQSVDVKTKF